MQHGSAKRAEKLDSRIVGQDASLELRLCRKERSERSKPVDEQVAPEPRGFPGQRA